MASPLVRMGHALHVLHSHRMEVVMVLHATEPERAPSMPPACAAWPTRLWATTTARLRWR